MANAVIHEYKLNYVKVQEVFQTFICNLDSKDRPQEEVESHLSKMLSLRFSKNSPRFAPKVLLIGPPGSGKYT